ncbi:aminopeptidase [Marmoricola endophyticus]|uniref:Aminopeptidase n=1 Tax=Marmoricola endophyticus TaxID=2040280 RepID=A0A917EY20_9ACTN|nr:alpha/beta fold hydrolase [Marmoricola endophyticus]GGF32894.1 aminopeptidase [Marmoricola endophyticus]
MSEDVPQVIEHEIEVPLDHGRPDGPTVPLFARELVAPGGERRPSLVFLQGGPGGEPPRPHLSPLSPSWLGRALQDFRVLLLDQRGTGRSAPLVDLETMAPQQQADHLALFRADSIVADAELLREALGIERWSLLGQSFGGFCTMTYLSRAPGALAAAYLTGGVPPVGAGPDAVYPRTYATMAARSRAHWERYPEDLPRFRHLLDLAAEGSLLLPDGEPVTPLRLRQVGHPLGMSYGTWDLHALLERDPRSPGFRLGLRDAMSFSGSSPLYALLQEACYADGTVTDWAARRTLPGEMEDPTLFFGEHLFPATYADDASLALYAETAELLAQRHWPRLYDEGVLGSNDVPGAAAVYAHDAYVDRGLSERTLAEVPGVEAWVTPDHEHDGLRTSGPEILDRLFSMVPPR